VQESKPSGYGGGGGGVSASLRGTGGGQECKPLGSGVGGWGKCFSHRGPGGWGGGGEGARDQASEVWGQWRVFHLGQS